MSQAEILNIILLHLKEAVQSTGQLGSKVDSLQRSIWEHSEELGKDEIAEILFDLAYDLDFYEPDIRSREEDPSYFDDEHAKDEINCALQRIEDILRQSITDI